MLKKEFSRALDLARSSEDLSKVEFDILDGVGLSNFKPVITTIDIVATFLRWQCQNLDGSWDSEELNNCWTHLRRKVTIV